MLLEVHASCIGAEFMHLTLFDIHEMSTSISRHNRHTATNNIIMAVSTDSEVCSHTRPRRFVNPALSIIQSCSHITDSIYNSSSYIYPRWHLWMETRTGGLGWYSRSTTKLENGTTTMLMICLGQPECTSSSV